MNLLRELIERVGLEGLLLLLAASMLVVPVRAEMLLLTVSSNADSGPGTLRLALEQAAQQPEKAVRIDFGDRDGLFSQPQTIELNEPLPSIVGDVHIDGYIRGLLWKAYGATISGRDRHRLFEVSPGGSLRLSGVTLRHGRAETGAAVMNAGRLFLEGVSLFENHALGQGGAVANLGEVYLVNSTLAWNQASQGGAVASFGELHVVNVTLYQNRALKGAALWGSGYLHLVNSILAGDSGHECHNVGRLSDNSSHNLIQGWQQGCGVPLLTEDPVLDPAGYFNGPTKVFPIGHGSPVVNLGLNTAARNAEGDSLIWDQRGNGDPRFASGFTDLGAFERQGRLPERFVVDMLDDSGLRACHPGHSRPSCPLRAALELAAAARQATPVHFDPDVFKQPRELVLKLIPPGADAPLLIDGKGVAPVRIVVPAEVPWQLANGVEIKVDSSLKEAWP